MIASSRLAYCLVFGACLLIPLTGHADEAQFEATSGVFAGEVMKVRWREARRTA
jgi:hypothetical protein